jgi:hypothetical protein
MNKKLSQLTLADAGTLLVGYTLIFVLMLVIMGIDSIVNLIIS